MCASVCMTEICNLVFNPYQPCKDLLCSVCKWHHAIVFIKFVIYVLQDISLSILCIRHVLKSECLPNAVIPYILNVVN